MIFIETEEQALQACHQLKEEQILSVDCEGNRLGRNGSLDLVAVHGVCSKCVFIFDVYALGNRVFECGLRNILESSSIEKLMFDCRKDSDALYHLYNVGLNNVTDLQLMDVTCNRSNNKSKVSVPSRSHPKYWQILGQNLDKLRGLGTCIESVLGESNVAESKKVVQRQMQQSDSLWRQRPLPEDLLSYCCEDVKNLHNLFIMFSSQNVNLKSIKAASQRYVDYERSIPSDRLKYYQSSHYLPHNVLDVEPVSGSGVVCAGCSKPFRGTEYDPKYPEKLCRVCRQVVKNRSNYRR